MSLLRGRKSCWWIPGQIRQRGQNQAHDHFLSIQYETQSVVLGRIERCASLCVAVRTGRKNVGMWTELQVLFEGRTGLHRQIPYLCLPIICSLDLTPYTVEHITKRRTGSSITTIASLIYNQHHWADSMIWFRQWTRKIEDIHPTG